MKIQDTIYQTGENSDLLKVMFQNDEAAKISFLINESLFDLEHLRKKYPDTEFYDNTFKFFVEMGSWVNTTTIGATNVQEAVNAIFLYIFNWEDTKSLDLDEAADKFSQRYQGAYKTQGEFARGYYEAYATPENKLANWLVVDWEKSADNLTSFMFEEKDGLVYVFDNSQL